MKTLTVRLILVLSTIFLFGCGGFTGLQALRAPAFSHNFSADLPTAPDSSGDCADGTFLLAGGCYPVKTTDISSNEAIAFVDNENQDDVNYAYTFPLNDSQIGLVSIKGSLTLQLNQKDFAENLVQIGFLDNCDGGDRTLQSDVEFATAHPDSVFFTALIVKADSAGKTTLPVNLTFNQPISQKACIYVLFAGDTVNKSTQARMINNLSVSYITPTSDPTTGQFDSIDGNGGEVCVGLSNSNCLDASSTDLKSYETTVVASESGTIREVYGSISNAPWKFNDIPAVSGAWGTTDMIFIDRQCATKNAGLASPGQFTANSVAAKDLIYRFHQDGNGADNVAQSFVEQDLNVAINAGDCIVHRRTANSNGAIDMESQLMLLLDKSVVDPSASASSSPPTALAPATSPAPTASDDPAPSSPAQSVDVGMAAAPAAPVDPLAGVPTATVYRYRGPGGHHFYTISSTSPFPASYQLEGPVFSVYMQSADGLTPVYVCAEGAQRFISLDSGCEGSTVSHTMGYAAASLMNGLRPLYRFDSNGDWLATINESEGQSAGYNEDGITAYVP